MDLMVSRRIFYCTEPDTAHSTLLLILIDLSVLYYSRIHFNCYSTCKIYEKWIIIVLPRFDMFRYSQDHWAKI